MNDDKPTIHVDFAAVEGSSLVVSMWASRDGKTWHQLSRPLQSTLSPEEQLRIVREIAERENEKRLEQLREFYRTYREQRRKES